MSEPFLSVMHGHRYERGLFIYAQLPAGTSVLHLLHYPLYPIGAFWCSASDCHPFVAAQMIASTNRMYYCDKRCDLLGVLVLSLVHLVIRMKTLILFDSGVGLWVK